MKQKSRAIRRVRGLYSTSRHICHGFLQFMKRHRTAVKHLSALSSISLIVLLIHSSVYSYLIQEQEYTITISSKDLDFTPNWDLHGEGFQETHQKQIIIQRSIFSERLVSDIGKHLLKNKWIKEVKSVHKEYPNKINVQVSYRIPTLALRKQDTFYIFDSEHVRLPGTYKHIPTMNGRPLMVLSGMTDPIPEPGQLCIASELPEAMRMNSIIAQEPLLQNLDINEIRVESPHRHSPNSAITLITQKGARIEWGYASDAHSRELTGIGTKEKIENLKIILKGYPLLSGIGTAKIYIKDTPIATMR